jgi:short-subunit dehydrogenase
LDTYFKHKVVVITGASSGIGEATAYTFAALQCKVVLAARSVEKLMDVKQRCETIGGESFVVKCDVSNEQDCKNLIAETVKQFGTVDILINNAGISMRSLFSELDMQVLKQVFDINFWGTVYCTKYALPYLLQQKGSVLSVSSVAGIKGLPGRTGYSASKFAMNGFMEALRIENSKTGLYVGVICPGYTASNIRNTALNKEGKSQTETPLDESKLMQPHQVATEMVDMIRYRKAEVVLTLQGKITKWLNKFFPRLVDRVVFNVVSKEKDSPFK